MLKIECGWMNVSMNYFQLNNFELHVYSKDNTGTGTVLGQGKVTVSVLTGTTKHYCNFIIPELKTFFIGTHNECKKWKRVL